MKKSKTLIYLVYHDQKDFIYYSLKSLKDSLNYADFDIIIVDTSTEQNFDENKSRLSCQIELDNKLDGLIVEIPHK